MFDRITHDPNVLSGRATLRGLRISVAQVVVARRDTVLDLSDLVGDRINSDEFFSENYITEGMKTLLTEGLRRLEGKSEQGVFKLTQAMGGGKTHNLQLCRPAAPAG